MDRSPPKENCARPGTRRRKGRSVFCVHFSRPAVQQKFRETRNGVPEGAGAYFVYVSVGHRSDKIVQGKALGDEREGAYFVYVTEPFEPMKRRIARF